MTRRELAAIIDHTLLRANATKADIDKLIEEAVQYRFGSVSINPVWTAYCAHRLEGSDIRVNPTIGFPLGANTSLIKIEEAREAVRNGANELDVVINIGGFKSGYHDFVERELTDIVKAVPDIPVKVIIETGYLAREEIINACKLCMRAGAAFVKTATGFGPTGATVEDVQLMRQVVGPGMGVKAAGGIRTWELAAALISAGANRIGTSASVDIISSLEA